MPATVVAGSKVVRWYDRYTFVAGIAEDHDPSILALEAGEEQAPTTIEAMGQCGSPEWTGWRSLGC
jgi:hypothetical protein